MPPTPSPTTYPPHAVPDDAGTVGPDSVSFAVPDDAVSELGLRRMLVSLKLISDNLSRICNSAGDEHFTELAAPLVRVDKKIDDLNAILYPGRHWIDDLTLLE